MIPAQETLVEDIRRQCRDINKAATSTIAFCKSYRASGQFDLWSSGEIPGHGFSTSDVLTDVQRTVRAVGGIAKARASLASLATCNNITNSLQALFQSISPILDFILNIESENRPFKLRDDFRFVTIISEEEVFNFGAHIAGIAQHIETLKSQLPLFAISATSDAQLEEQDFEALTARSLRVAEIALEGTTKLEELTSAKAKAETLVGEIGEVRDSAAAYYESTRTESGSALASIESARSESDDLVKQIEEKAQSVEQQKERVENLTSESAALHAQLLTFSNELENLKEELRQAHDQIRSANEKQEIQLKSVDDLIHKAVSMVSSATVAGLAKAFGDERASLGKSMNNAIVSFFVGIASLFFVTLILAAYVFEIPLQLGDIKLSGSGNTPALGDEITVAGVLSRTIILLAPFWLTLFSARRYRNLFDLRQQYSHKYNMAFSVDGFKQQAPSYQEEMAAWVFHIIAEGPVTNRPKSSGMDDNPLPSLQDIVSMSADRFEKLLGRRDTNSSQ